MQAVATPILNEQTQPEFPVLMISTKTAALVYMTAEVNEKALAGVCLHSGASDYAPGQFLHWDRALMEIYRGEIILSNQ
jgi:hypothetical protein